MKNEIKINAKIYNKEQIVQEIKRILKGESGKILQDEDRQIALWCLIQRKEPKLTLKNKKIV